MSKTSTPKASPAKMLSELSNTATLKWIGVALLIHVIVFGATSVNYLRTVFDRSASEKQDSAVAATADAPPPAVPPVVAKKPAPPEKTSQAADEGKMLEARKDSTVVKSITAAAKSTELPKTPTRNALDLDGLEGK